MWKKCKETADWTKHGRVFVSSTGKMFTLEYSLFFFCFLSSSLLWNSLMCDNKKKNPVFVHKHTHLNKNTLKSCQCQGEMVWLLLIFYHHCVQEPQAAWIASEDSAFKIAAMSHSKKHKMQSIQPRLATSHPPRTPAHRQKLAVTHATGIWEVRQSWGYHCGEEDSWAS